MATAVFQVPDISCAHCEHAIKGALSPVAGVTRVDVDIPAKQVTVDYEAGSVGIEEISTVLESEDYPVASVVQAG